MTSSQSVPDQQSQNPEITNFWEFLKIPQRDQTPGKERIWTPEKEKSSFHPPLVIPHS